MPAVYLYEQTQFLDNSGNPLSGGKIFTYQAGSVTPLATYTDSTGTAPTTNPIILDSAGYAGSGIWLQAATYKFVIQTSAGAAIKTLDGINVSVAASGPFAGVIDTVDLTMQQSTAATAGANQSGNNLKIQGTYWDGAVSQTDTWNVQDVLGTGTNPTSTLSLTHSGSTGAAKFSVGAIAASGQITSTLATGTAPFSIASTTVVPNLNVSQLEGGTWEIPGTIGSTTPNTVNSSGGALNGTIGAATPNTGKFTTVNKVTITTPATGSTLTIADGKTATVNNSLTLAGVDSTTQTFQASDTIVGRATTDTLTNKTLTGASSGNSTNLLNFQGILGALTGNASDQVVYTYTLPANTLGAGKGLRILLAVSHGTGTGAITYKLNFGGTALVSGAAPAAGAQLVNGEVVIFNNAGVTNAQTSYSFPWFATATPFNAASGTAAISTTSSVVITLTFNALNTEQITPQFWMVELIQ